MSDREQDAGGVEVELSEEETQPIAAPGKQSEPVPPSAAEAGGETTVWARGPAPVLLPEVETEPEAAAPAPTESAPPSPVETQILPPNPPPFSAELAAPSSELAAPSSEEAPSSAAAAPDPQAASPSPPQPQSEAAPPPMRAPAAAPAPAPAAPASAAAPIAPASSTPAAAPVQESTADPLGEAATVIVGAAAADSASHAPIAPSSSLHPMLLERVEPSLGRGERIRLDASHWKVSLGRADSNDVRLYTATASREHAVIAGNESGDWVITPTPGKKVKIDGEFCSNPVVLEVGMNLVMGTDHLRCVTEGLARPEMTAQTAAEGFASSVASPGRSLAGIGLTWWLIGGVTLIGIGLIAFAWFGGGDAS